jgi:poly-gamma-glutamate synthase PgsB/CapB
MPMSRVTPNSALKVLVTGSRGKSSIVRFLHAALQDAGLQTYARITGVEPRQLGPEKARTISRSSAAHVEEMRWWLRRLPGSAQGIVLENSAITPDLQGLAGRWLQPDITVLSNVLPDHQEVWGPTSACAAEVLTSGIPTENQVLLPADLKSDHYLLELLKRRSCKIHFVEPISDTGADAGADFQANNLGLAVATVERFGFAKVPALESMLCLQRDKYDFSVVKKNGAELAMAFSANDIRSTRTLFRSLSWSEEETRLIYNHRMDRPARFRSFLNWLNSSRWREVLIIGDKPRMKHCSARYLHIKSAEGLLRLFKPGDRIFGCGNIAGLPMALASVLDR